MTDLSEFYEKIATPCAVGRFLSTLSNDEREVFAEACGRDDISHASLNRWLTKRGLKTTDRTVQTHRTGKCRCDG